MGTFTLPMPAPTRAVFTLFSRNIPISLSPPLPSSSLSSLPPQPSVRSHPFARDFASAPRNVRCVVEQPRRHLATARAALLEALKEDDVASADVVVVMKIGDEMYFDQRDMQVRCCGGGRRE